MEVIGSQGGIRGQSGYWSAKLLSGGEGKKFKKLPLIGDLLTYLLNYLITYLLTYSLTHSMEQSPS